MVEFYWLYAAFLSGSNLSLLSTMSILSLLSSSSAQNEGEIMRFWIIGQQNKVAKRMGLNWGKQAIKACFYKALTGKRREKKRWVRRTVR